MNRQEAFNKAYLAIIAQGCQSGNEDGCAYRGYGGAKCAVGHLISDEQIERYDVRNNSSVWGLDDELLGEILPGDTAAVSFLRDLQRAHDDGFDGKGYIEGFKQRAAEFAANYNLTVPEAA